MFIDRNYKIWLACAQDDFRPSLSSVYVERLEREDKDKDGIAFNGVAVAANGFILAVVPVELDEGEEGCLIPRQVWQYAARLPQTVMTKGRLYLGLGTSKDTHVVFNNGWMARKLTETTFPSWRGIVPERERSTQAENLRSLQPALLSTIQSALGAKDGVLLSLPALHSKAILVESLGARGTGAPKPPFGVLMPMFIRDFAGQARPVGAASGVS